MGKRTKSKYYAVAKVRVRKLHIPPIIGCDDDDDDDDDDDAVYTMNIHIHTHIYMTYPILMLFFSLVGSYHGDIPHVGAMRSASERDRESSG